MKYTILCRFVIWYWKVIGSLHIMLQGSIFSDELRRDVALLNLRHLSCIVWSKNPSYQLVGSLFGRHDRYANEGVSRSMSSIGGPAYDHIHHLVGSSPSTKRNRASNSNFMKPDGNIDDLPEFVLVFKKLTGSMV